MEDGGTVEIGVFGREGVLGLLAELVTREAFGRYVVQMSGTASRIALIGSTRCATSARTSAS